MNNQQNTLARIIEIINKSRSGIIIVPPNPSVDTIAASTSLYLGLNKIGKNISLVCSQKPSSDLTAGDKFQTVIGAGGDSLMITFPYTEGSIDKVDYNIQGESFNLIVTPRPGFQKLNPNKVGYSYTGGVVDFIIVIDAPTLNNLGEIYSDNQNQFTGRDIINIDRHLTNGYFGTVNYVNKAISSISELILSVIQAIKIESDHDIATNLYTGIAAATNNFTSYSTNAETFENIAVLLRMGAVKKTFKKSGQAVNKQPANKPAVSNRHTNIGRPETQPVKPIEIVEKETQKEPQSPQDWLKPKIFKGRGLI